MRSLLREPLVHFLVIGATLFAAYRLLNRGPEGQPDEIVVSSGRIEHLATRFDRFHQRPPTAEELKGLIDQYVREEILSREALKLGLDQDDAVIRNRLQLKMEFVATELAAASEPTEAEMAEWMDRHAEDYSGDPMFSFRHVYLNPDKYGSELDGHAAALIAELPTAGENVDLSGFGDSFLLPHEFAEVSQSAVAGQFGTEFAGRLAELERGAWTGPIPSGFGVHLVMLTARSENPEPALADVREQVRRDLVNERRVEANRRFLELLLAKYRVKIEWPASEAAGVGQALATGP